jgi:hypothetical protein
MTPTEISDLSAVITGWISAINDVEAKYADYKSSVEAKETVADDSEKEIRKWANKFKTHDAFTNEIADAMQIKSSPSPAAGEDDKPHVTVKTYAGYVRIKFTKKGFTAVKIFVRLKGQTQWKYLATDTNSPYDDHSPLAAASIPEEREYMAIGLVKDTETGQPSDIVSVVFGG